MIHYLNSNNPFHDSWILIFLSNDTFSCEKSQVNMLIQCRSAWQLVQTMEDCFRKLLKSAVAKHTDLNRLLRTNLFHPCSLTRITKWNFSFQVNFFHKSKKPHKTTRGRSGYLADIGLWSIFKTLPIFRIQQLDPDSNLSLECRSFLNLWVALLLHWHRDSYILFSK